MKESLEMRIYMLSCECKEAVYSNIEHKEFVRQMAKKLESLAKEIAIDNVVAMQESSMG